MALRADVYTAKVAKRHCELTDCCGLSLSRGRKNANATVIRDTPENGFPRQIHLTLIKRRCPNGDTVFTPSLPGIDLRLRMTIRCIEFATVLAFRLPFTEVAWITGVPPRTLRQLVDRAVARLDRAPIEAPKILKLDGAHLGFGRRHKRITYNVCDGNERLVAQIPT